jgi:hypothetical protein
MLSREPRPERRELRFQEAVLASFTFLSELGFRPLEENATFVRYESSEVFVNVYHGRSSYELGVEIGRLRMPSEKASIFSIVRWAGAGNAEGLGQHVIFQTSSTSGVQEFVPKLAHLVQKYAIPFLKANDEAYKEIEDINRHSAAEYQKEVHLRDVRRRAEAAWHSKDYAQVAESFGAIRKELSEIEAKKLTYAEEHLLTAQNAGSRPRSRRPDPNRKPNL